MRLVKRLEVRPPEGAEYTLYEHEALLHKARELGAGNDAFVHPGRDQFTRFPVCVEWVEEVD